MKFTEICKKIFNETIEKYHLSDNVNATIENPYPENSIENLLYVKNWIDTVQWHLEDIIRDENIDPVTAIKIKRKIDKSNQNRTDKVEYIDSYFLQKYSQVIADKNATINTESPAWAIDRLSILALKIYHMKEETLRTAVDQNHIANCQKKLDILLEQQVDLSKSIDELIQDIETGKKYMKVYKQMKMYNDPSLNPVLYANKK